MNEKEIDSKLAECTKAVKSLTDMMAQLKTEKEDIKRKKDPNRRLSKQEVSDIKTMLLAGEEKKIIAEKMFTKLKVVKYWQVQLKIVDPVAHVSVKDMAYEDRLELTRLKHDPTNKHFSLTEDGKKRHDELQKCPACFSESQMNLDDYNKFISRGNWSAVQYVGNHPEIKLNKAIISQDKVEVKKELDDSSNGIFDESGDVIVNTDTIKEPDRPTDIKLNENGTSDRYFQPAPDHTKLSHRDKKPNAKNTKKERKLVKQMNNVDIAVVKEFLKSKGVSIVD